MWPVVHSSPLKTAKISKFPYIKSPLEEPRYLFLSKTSMIFESKKYKK